MVQNHPGFGFVLGKRAGLWAVVALGWTTGAFAEDVLKTQGLIRVGSFYILDAEALVQTKLEEASAQFESFAAVVAQQAAIVESAMQLKALDLQGIELRRRIGDINVQLGQFPIPRHRNSVHRAAVNELSTERAGYQLSLNEINSQMGVLRNQAATPKQKQEIQAELKRRREPLLTALRTVRMQVDDATKRYQELAGKEDVQAALEAQRRMAKVNLKLGPSSEFRADVALLRKYEKMVQPVSSNAGSPSKTRSTNGRKAGH